MANVIKLRKGLDINLTGKASKDVALQVAQAGEYALVPAAFVGVTPKVVYARATMSMPEMPCL